jgi:hypothetical protein
MKKILLYALPFALIIMTGCKSQEKGAPKDVLHNFLTALAKKDFSKAKTYATKDSDGMISMMETGMQGMQSMDDNSHANEMMELVNNMKIGAAQIEGDKATVPVADSKSNESIDFLLKKENGDWKVAFDMATLMDMASKKMKEHGMDMNNPEIKKKMDSAMENMPDMH